MKIISICIQLIFSNIYNGPQLEIKKKVFFFEKLWLERQDSRLKKIKFVLYQLKKIANQIWEI